LLRILNPDSSLFPLDFHRTKGEDICCNNKYQMKVEVWSDIMCPFCYIGKRNYENAFKQFRNAASVQIEWHSFQLDPAIP